NLQNLAFKYRGGIWTVLFVWVLFMAEPLKAHILPGLIFVTAGQGIRLWAAGTITLYRGEKVKAERLVTWGPYSLCRNPLYVANGLIGLGWCFLSGNLQTLWVYFLFFAGLYVFFVIPHEERFLAASFPEDFREYTRRVGRFFPKTVPSAGSLSGPFSGKVLWRSERHSCIVTCVGTMAFLLLRWFV
ncbi:MAG: methyltransferase family protein, partial [Thermovirgaceae bacterium]